MNGIVIPSLYLLAGMMAYACIMAYAAVYHFASALNTPRDVAQMVFSAMCLLTVPFALSIGVALHSVDVTDFVLALKWNLAAALLFLLLFPWFIALYTGKIHRLLLIGLNTLFAVLFVVNLVQPYTLQYDQLDSLHLLHLPWGETVTRGEGHQGPWTYITITGIMVMFGYATYLLGNAYHRTRRRTDLWMMLAIGLYMLSTIQGILTRLSVIDFIDASPIGVLAMTIVMSVTLSYETEQRLRTSERNFRTLFENSPTGMVAIDPETRRIVQANHNALEMSGFTSGEILNKTAADLTHPDDLDV